MLILGRGSKHLRRRNIRICDLKERDLILREKELNLKMHLQKEQEQRDQHLYISMEKIKQQQDELSKQLCELKEILASLSKSC